MKSSNQSLFAFELAVIDAALAVANARLQVKLAAKARRAILKHQAEIEKNYRRFKRQHIQKQKAPDEHAQCGLRYYSRSPHNVALGNYWKHCHDCGQLLIYTSDRNAKPKVCAGRKS